MIIYLYETASYVMCFGQKVEAVRVGLTRQPENIQRMYHIYYHILTVSSLTLSSWVAEKQLSVRSESGKQTGRKALNSVEQASCSLFLNGSSVE